VVKRIGVYLCRGCGIGDALDCGKLENLATGEYDVSVCKQQDVLCTEAARDDILEDIKNQGINAVLIAACSPRVLTDVFQFPGSVLLERVNLREQVVWCLPPRDDDTQMMAEDYLRMGVTKIQKSEIPEPFQEEIDKTILVVGGGIAGMNSALEAARAGYSVVLVEKEAQLGGWMSKQARTFPTQPPYTDLESSGVEELISALESTEGVRIMCGAEIQGISGAPGMFEARVRIDGSEDSIQVGAIVQATGWKPYDATNLGHLGYGRCANVLTSVELEQMASAGEIARPSDGEAPGSVAFVQCAGSRDPEHLPYCSSVCCMVTLKQATYLKERRPDTEVYILYKDIRTPGQYEEFYRKVQKDGVVFIMGEVLGVSENENRVVVEAEDLLLGDLLSLEVDLVVLATGMTPSTAVDEDVVPEFEKTVNEDSETASDSDKEEGGEVRVEEGMILHLAYRQGPELPKLAYGMPDSHFICFPFETLRTGIYAAGCVRKPMDARGAREDAVGAVLKAIQCVEMTSRGEAVHPRAGDQSYPELFMQRCTQCKRCTEECPFGMYNEDENFNPLPNPTRCRRCGICMGSCPERIISFKDFSVDMIGSMIKAIEVPEEDEEKPRVLILACENDAYPALDMLGQRRLNWSPYVRVIPLRCLGSINLVWIADALSKGIDGVLILGCVHGDDYQCHMVTGSELASYRLEKISETLERLVLESDRIRMEQVEMIDFVRLSGVVAAFMERIEEIGPNPYKGF
jgi:quinone-modifying oxidoreductase subunit QmoB